LVAVRRCRPTICDNEVFGLDIAVEDLLIMTYRDCVAHVGEHGCDELEAIVRQELGRMPVQGKTRCRWCS
jgi:hypothetical protein